jgi:protein tyrosine phosphatase (PTP) superfamily phosphohydrolase (DUF442 family)
MIDMPHTNKSKKPQESKSASVKYRRTGRAHTGQTNKEPTRLNPRLKPNKTKADVEWVLRIEEEKRAPVLCFCETKVRRSAVDGWEEE